MRHPDRVVIRRSRRARHARIVVAPFRQAELVVPLGTTEAQAEQILRHHRTWIERRRARARLAERDQLGLQRDGVLWVAGEPVPTTLAGSALERRYRAEARRRAVLAVHEEGARLDIGDWSGIRIGDPRTRWGSCSSRGTLSFSWRLVIAPAGVLRYVVIHELCHLRHPDHSTAFWHLVDRACPGRRWAQTWLRRRGAELQAYRP